MPKMKTYRGWSIGVVVLGVLLMLRGPAISVAQDQDQDQDQVARGPETDGPDAQDQGDQDPPSRVARMNYTQGSVSFQPGGEGDWIASVPNRPLTTGDNLWSDQDSRAEMHVGSTAIRLAPETSVTFLALDDRTTQLRLSAGTIILRVRHLDDGDLFEVDTPNLAFNLQHPGEYRVDVDSNGDMTNVSVFSGRGEVTGGGYSYTVVAGQSARFSGTDQLNYDIAQLPRADDFDNWAFERDHREDGAESGNYVSQEMTGYEDLDDYGRWQYVGGYGTVWVPSGVASDWAPYRNGHWAYIDPWGWTWVEDEPWGFAPFHYGRWAYAGSRWCWVPGPVAVRPVYAPALVAFVGGVGISIGGGPGVGWFPLAPGEVYVPYYRGSRHYVERVNVTNTVVNVTRVTTIYNQRNVTNITYVNQRANNGVTLVSRDTFVNARPVARNLGRFDARQLENARVERRIDVQPIRASVLGSGAPARYRPPQAIINRQVVATQRPAPPRQPFDQRQRDINIRTERPGEQPRQTGTPVVRNAGTDRPLARPQQPVSPPDTAQRPQFPRPEARAQQPMVAPRVAQGTVNQNDNRSSQGWSHPQAKPAPPVQERNPAQARDDENKFRNWQQQRPQAAPVQNRAPQEQHQAPHQAPHDQDRRPKSQG
jgi:FecR protein